MSRWSPVTAAAMLTLWAVSNGERRGPERPATEASGPRVYFQHDFEDGTLGPMRSDAGHRVSVVRGVAHTGQFAAMSVAPAERAISRNGVYSSLTFRYRNPVNPAAEPAGVYQRWFQMLPAATIANVSRGQVKLHLARYNHRQTREAPGWLMMGIGSEFGSQPTGRFVAFQDFNVVRLPGSRTNVVIEPGRWYEIQTWYQNSGGIGRARLWIDGAMVLDASSPLLGSGNPSDALMLEIGMVWAQNAVGELVVYIDDVAASDRYID